MRLAVKYRTPVILLTDGYLANGAEPWLLPDVDDLPDISVPFATEPNHDDGFWPYLRDPETLARPWAIPGTPGLMHRIGGIEKEDGSGNISYQPENHERMVRLRAGEGRRHRRRHPRRRPRRRRRRRAARARLGLDLGCDHGRRPAGAGHGAAVVSHAHLRHLNPFPRRPGRRARAGTRRCSCPEMNLGQLAMLVRAEFLVDAQSYTKVQGLPFRAAEMEARMLEEINR